MEIESDQSGGSFYESFSDLLFTTMAIFVLLMIVFLIQVNAASDAANQQTMEAQQLAASAEQLKADLDRTEQALRDAQQAAVEAQQAKENAERDANELKPKPIDLVIAIDGSSSMGPTLKEVQSTIQSAAAVGCRISPRFRIAVVIYRDSQTKHVLGFTEIRSHKSGDNDRGMVALDQFLTEKVVKVTRTVTKQPGVEGSGTPTGESYMVSRMEPLSAIVDFPQALAQVSDVLKQSDPNSKQVVIFIGDVGPWELGDAATYDERVDIEARVKSLAAMQTMAEQWPHLAVLTVFVASNARHDKISRSFFEALAKEAGTDRGRFSDGMASVALTVVEAIVR